MLAIKPSARIRAALVDRIWAFFSILRRPHFRFKNLHGTPAWHGTCNLGAQERQQDSLKFKVPSGLNRIQVEE